MLEPICDLGDAVTKAWRDKNHNEEAFADIATELMAESRVLKLVEPADIVRWLASSPRLPRQKYREFGQPPINVYMGQDFHIEVLLWLDSTTSIHQHSFAGAFGVLAGSSVHSTYRFDLKEVSSKLLLFGDINFTSSELLKRGDIRTIRPGNSFIHSLFHLDSPSLSLVVRTQGLNQYKPQYSYLKPWMAIDPFYEPEPAMTQIRLLDALRRTNEELFWEAAQTIASSGDLWMLYKVLMLTYRRFSGSQPWQQLLGIAHEHHGEQVNYLLPCLKESVREIKIIARRESVKDAEHRFFLALLLNVPEREIIYKLISNRFPDVNPQALILRWVKELSDKKLLGLEFNPISLRMFQSALQDVSLNSAKETLIEEFSLSPTLDQDDKLNSLWQEIRTEQFFEPLFQV